MERTGITYDIAKWKKSTRTVFTSILIRLIPILLFFLIALVCKIIISRQAGVQEFFESVNFKSYEELMIHLQTLPPITSFMITLVTITGILCIITIVAQIVGYLIMLKGLNSFMRILSPEDQKSVRILNVGTFANLLAYFIFFIVPCIVAIVLASKNQDNTAGLIFLVVSIMIFALLVFITAVTFNLAAYNRLRKSTTLPPEAAQGFSIALIGTAICILSIAIDFIPGVGNYLSNLALFTFCLCMIAGWKNIKNALNKYIKTGTN